VLIAAREPSAILGYYTLSASAGALADIPDTRRFGKCPRVSAILLGRFAVGRQVQGKGIARLLLVDALGRADEASQCIGAAVVVVDAKDVKAVEFYRHFGFLPCDDQFRLFLPINTIAELGISPAPLAAFRMPFRRR